MFEEQILTMLYVVEKIFLGLALILKNKRMEIAKRRLNKLEKYLEE